MKILIGSIVFSALLGVIASHILNPSLEKPNTVREIYLSDGTRCAVMDTYSKSAISCDWQTAKEKK